MERLTYWNEEYGCWSYHGPSGSAAKRLAAYEDTGLEPEEVEQIKKAAAHMMFEDVAHFVRYTLSNFDELQKYKALGDYNRLCELKQADDEGRCVVLPCKIGDPVWRLYDDCDLPGDCYTKQKCKGCEYRNLFIEEQAFCLSMLSQNGKLAPPYYTTFAEAQAALRREQEDE